MAEQIVYEDRAAVYYDKLLCHVGSTYLHTKESFPVFARFLARELRIQNPDAESVLVIGCGRGAFCRELIKHGFDVTGLEESDEVVREAQRFETNRYVEFAIGDMQTFRSEKKFDIILCMFEHIRYNQSFEDVQKSLQNMNRALVPGGLLVMEFHYPAPTVGEQEIKLPPVTHEGREIQEHVYIRSEGDLDVRRSLYKIYKDEKHIENKMLQRAPLLRIKPSKLRLFLEDAGFSQNQIMEEFVPCKEGQVVIFARKGN